MSNAVLEELDFDPDAFEPAEYNHTYYDEVMEDEAALIKWQAGDLHKIITEHLGEQAMSTFPSQFDAGSGPSVHHLLAFEKYSDQIHLADYLPQNLAEIGKWIRRESTAHDWSPFTRQILAAEGEEVTDDSVKAREEAVRGKIASFNPLDFKEPTDEMRTYKAPFVTSFFVADSATSSKPEFAAMTKNAFNIVEPNGLFVAAYLGGCEEYLAGDTWFKSADVTRSDIEEALTASGAKDVQVWRFDTPSLAAEGFDHIFAAVAKR